MKLDIDGFFRARVGYGCALACLALFIGFVGSSLTPSSAEEADSSPETQDVEYATPSRLITKARLLSVAKAGDRLVAVGDWGHVVLSDDGGLNWRQAQKVPTRVMLTEVSFADDKHGWAVGYDLTVIHTQDGGENWELQYRQPEEEVQLLSVWAETPTRAFATGAYGIIMETEDSGKTWTRDTLPEEAHLNHIFEGPAGTDTIFIAGEVGSVYRSTDVGRTWELLHPPYEGSFWGGLSLRDGNILVYGMRGTIFRSTDRGDTWSAVAEPEGQSLAGGTQLDSGKVILVGLGGVVLKGDMDGSNFTSTVREDRRAISDVIQGAGGKLLLFGEVGIETMDPDTSKP